MLDAGEGGEPPTWNHHVSDEGYAAALPVGG
jgi:hypothetical protein